MSSNSVIARSPALRDDEAIQPFRQAQGPEPVEGLDRDECASLLGDDCDASAATARFAHLAMTII